MLTMSEVVALMKELKPRFFEGLTPSEVASIVSPATKLRFLAHSVMAHEGHPADRLFLMIHGRARGFCMTPRGDKVPVLWFPPGEVFGTAALLPESAEYLVSTEALINSTALVWDRATIKSLSAQFPRLVENTLLIGFDYLVLYRSLHVAATYQTARQRLALVLGNLAAGLGQRVADGVELNIKNEELAYEAHITIFTASRLLSEWQRKGIVTKSHGKVVVRSPEDLMLLGGD